MKVLVAMCIVAATLAAETKTVINNKSTENNTTTPPTKIVAGTTKEFVWPHNTVAPTANRSVATAPTKSLAQRNTTGNTYNYTQPYPTAAATTIIAPRGNISTPMTDSTVPMTTAVIAQQNTTTSATNPKATTQITTTTTATTTTTKKTGR